MSSKKIYMTRQELSRLRLQLDALARPDAPESEFTEALAEAQIVDADELPSDVVTLNSRVRLRDCESGVEMVYTLVMPAESDPDRYRISVTTPIGRAVIGCAVGDAVEWVAPRGTRRARVEEVIQRPGPAGSYTF